MFFSTLYLHNYRDYLKEKREINLLLETFLLNDLRLKDMIVQIMSQETNLGNPRLFDDDDPNKLVQSLFTGLLLSTLVPIYELNDVPLDRGCVFSFRNVDEEMAFILNSLDNSYSIGEGFCRTRIKVEREPLLFDFSGGMTRCCGRGITITPELLLKLDWTDEFSPAEVAEIRDSFSGNFAEVKLILGKASGSNGSTRFEQIKGLATIGLRAFYNDKGRVYIYPSVYTPDGVIIGDSNIEISLEVANQIFGLVVKEDEIFGSQSSLEPLGKRVPCPV